MVTINGKNYYSKDDLRVYLGCCEATINKRIAKTNTKGYNIGRKKYYTQEQIQVLVECPSEKKKTN